MRNFPLSVLALPDLASGRIPAVTPAIGGYQAEACGVCLESQGHLPGTNLKVTGERHNDYSVIWPPVPAQAPSRGWDVSGDAVEHGAAGLAILLIIAETDYTVIERSVRGTGVDYWLGQDSAALPFQERARLEVSGILRGTEGEIATRVRQKLNQTRRSDYSRLPAYVVVIEFSRPVAEVRRRNERS